MRVRKIVRRRGAQTHPKRVLPSTACTYRWHHSVLPDHEQDEGKHDSEQEDHELGSTEPAVARGVAAEAVRQRVAGCTRGKEVRK